MTAVVRHRWVEDATSMPTYPVHRCEKCGAKRIGFKGSWRWRTVGQAQWRPWSRRSPTCKTRDA